MDCSSGHLTKEERPPGLSDVVMFMGEFEHSIDEKGRLAIPKKFREHFSDGLVLTRGLDRCLWVYTVSEWAMLADKISQLPLTKSDARAVTRMVFSGAADCQLDQQGRFVVPSYLRDYAGIGDLAVVLGVNTRLELWSKEDWEQTRASVESEGALLAEHLASLGIL